jgi:hypothetical protein
MRLLSTYTLLEFYVFYLGFQCQARRNAAGRRNRVGITGAHVKTASLSSINISPTGWVKHVSAQHPEFVDSQNTVELNSDPSPSSNTSGTYHTTSITIQIVLPRSRDLLPTFHSCFVSRIYLLELNLSYHGVGTGERRALKLQVPVELDKTCDQESSIMSPQNAVGGSKLSQFGPPPKLSRPRVAGHETGYYGQDNAPHTGTGG